MVEQAKHTMRNSKLAGHSFQGAGHWGQGQELCSPPLTDLPMHAKCFLKYLEGLSGLTGHLANEVTIAIG